MAVAPHVHLSPVMMIASFLVVFAVFGTLHLLALSSDHRLARAFIALGF
jgi:hypothetical protein